MLVTRENAYAGLPEGRPKGLRISRTNQETAAKQNIIEDDVDCVDVRILSQRANVYDVCSFLVETELLWNQAGQRDSIDLSAKCLLQLRLLQKRPLLLRESLKLHATD